MRILVIFCSLKPKPEPGYVPVLACSFKVSYKCTALFLLVRGMWVTILRDKVLNFGDSNLHIRPMGWWVVRCSSWDDLEPIQGTCTCTDAILH